MTPGKQWIIETIPTTKGARARQALQTDGPATLLGVTSRGAFLLLPSGWVVFLSGEAYHGPLTINLPAEAGWLARLQPGARAVLNGGDILLHPAGLVIRAKDAASWSLSPPETGALAPDARLERLRLTARRTLALQENGRQSALLRAVIDGASTLRPQVDDSTRQTVGRLRAALASAGLAAIVDALQPLLGLGLGLTPSGDDLIAGLLLASIRWGEALHLAWDPAGLAARIVPLARQGTTALSASLIACAAQGQADERLALALDGIMTGQPGVEVCAENLAAWGASSGGDCLAGMALMIASSVV